MKDAREKSRILSIIIFILSLIVMSINGCNSGGYEDNFIEDKYKLNYLKLCLLIFLTNYSYECILVFSLADVSRL